MTVIIQCSEWPSAEPGPARPTAGRKILGAAVPPAEIDLPADKKVCYGPPAFPVELEPVSLRSGVSSRKGVDSAPFECEPRSCGAVKMFLRCGVHRGVLSAPALLTDKNRRGSGEAAMLRH